MPKYRATYVVRFYPPVKPFGGSEFVGALECYIDTYFEAGIEARAEQDDPDVEIAASRWVEGPTHSTPVRYTVEHQARIDGGSDHRVRVQRRLEDLLGIPQSERVGLDIERVVVEGPVVGRVGDP